MTGFGERGYWHLVSGAPSGSVEHCAAKLLEMARANRLGELCPEDPKKGPDIARAMALELAVAALLDPVVISRTADGADLPEHLASLPPINGIPSVVHELFAVEGFLPKWAAVILDPAFIYSGEGVGVGVRRQPAWLRLENIVRELDMTAILATGDVRQASDVARQLLEIVDKSPSLKRGVGHLWGEAPAPALEKSVRRWRKKPRYKEEKEMVTRWRKVQCTE